VSRAQRSTSRAFTPVFAGYGGALQTPISGLPEIGAQMCASRASPTCVDRYGPWRSRISDAPLHFVARCIASGTHKPRTRAYPIHFSNSPSRSRGAFLRPSFATLLRSPRMRVGGAPRDVRVLGGTPVGHAVTRRARRLRGALRPMTRDARLSALHRGGFGLRGRACLTGICAGSVTASSSHPGRSAWRAGSLPPGASGYEPPPQDATPRSAFRFALENAPSMSEAGNASSIASNCSQVKNSFCRREKCSSAESDRVSRRRAAWSLKRVHARP
jgi:hypothetical protein